MKRPDLGLGLFAVQIAEEDALVEAAKLAEIEAARDLVGERLVEEGYLTNYNLQSWGEIGRPHDYAQRAEYVWPWNLKCSVMQWPAHAGFDAEGKRAVVLEHPLLVDHPLILELTRKGYPVITNPDLGFNSSGVPYSFFSRAAWYTAQFIVEDGFERLFDLLPFTTQDLVLCAAAMWLSHAHSTQDLQARLSRARQLMATLQISEPACTPLMLRRRFTEPELLTGDAWPINPRHRRFAENDAAVDTWAWIHAVENGWFRCTRGFVGWSKAGRVAHNSLIETREAA